jgi:hypothetical protein
MHKQARWPCRLGVHLQDWIRSGGGRFVSGSSQKMLNRVIGWATQLDVSSTGSCKSDEEAWQGRWWWRAHRQWAGPHRLLNRRSTYLTLGMQKMCCGRPCVALCSRIGGSWAGRGVDGRLDSTTWAWSESMAATRSRTTAMMTQMGGTREVHRGNPSAREGGC